MNNTSMFSKKNLDAIKNLMSVEFYKKNTNIYWEGDRSNKLFYVVEGRVKLFKSAYDGKDLVLHYYIPDDLFGEISCLGSDEYSFTANAATDCKIGVINEQDIENLIPGNAGLAFEFMKWVGLTNQYTQIKMRDLLFYGKNGALASTLIRMVHGYGKKQSDGIHYTLDLTNTDLAQLIGSTRETVNRMLQTWKKDGAIGYHHGYIVIKDMDYLKKICHCEDRCPMNICRL
ncbi:Crp/Fnr family transcriptional regulator [Sporolactobacillus sp. THM7-4]|nr:Crp/Fnr family transcriptional regulator [Sporolactobacillus sp. THM7-4]